jgi:hypothetical protein
MIRPFRLGVFAMLLGAMRWRPAATPPERLAAFDDAFVDGDAASGRWTRYELRDLDSNRRHRVAGATLVDAGFDLFSRDDGVAQIFAIHSVGGTAARLK